uniref:Uncharacterized protein n=1 Tax=Anguilla anguilla TaxID=7936 RepID=A0A0E9UCX3_ANGAN
MSNFVYQVLCFYIFKFLYMCLTS